jgi:hypothetical protein
MQYINNVSLLASQDPTIDKEVYVQCYSNAYDGGGGYFVFRLTAELPPGLVANGGIYFNGPSGSGGL